MRGSGSRMSEDAVALKQLKKSFGLKPVLRGIDLTVPQGQCIALLGTNGAGKTTILRILAGLAKPSSGTVCVFGLRSTDDARRIRRLIGFVAHEPYLYEELTVIENLLFFGRMYLVENVQKRANELLQRVGLEKRKQDRVHALSRGLVQRLAWARSLLHNPPLLLLDEADAGLDQQGQKLMDVLLAEHRERGGSVIFTTHQLERALTLSDSIVIVNGGRIVYREESAQITLEDLRHGYQEVVG